MAHQIGAVSVDHIRISPAILPSGTFLVGIPAVNHTYSVSDHGVIYSSTPLAFVIMILFAVNPVLVPHAMLSLVLDRVFIELVFPEMRPESASSATFIDPDIDPRVNI